MADLVERFVAAGYIDDAVFARARTGSLLRTVRQALRPPGLAAVRQVYAGGGMRADEGEGDKSLVVDLDGSGGGIGDALEGDREAVLGRS